VFRQLWRGWKCEGRHTFVQGTGIVVIREIVLMKFMASANVEEVENCILSLIFVRQGLSSDELKSLSKMGNKFCIYVCGVKGWNVPLRFESVLGLKPEAFASKHFYNMPRTDQISSNSTLIVIVAVDWDRKGERDRLRAIEPVICHGGKG
jgi:hypothetical protein